jgi:amidase
MHCRTTTSELAHSGVTNTPLWGVSRNPWNTDYSPGGSSGGSVAAAMTVLADGTDGGGSLRLPASVGGLIGYKPPWGRNPLDRDHPGETVLHHGPITRTLGDAALMQNAMSGAHPADLYSLRDRVVLPQTFEAIKGWKIAFSMDLGYFEVDAEVQKNTRAALEVFKSLGCTVDEVDVGWTPAVQDAFEVTWQSVFHALAGDLLPRWQNELTPSLVAILEAGKKHGVRRYYGVQKVRFEMYQKLGPILDQYDALVCPTMAIAGLKAEHNDLDPNFTINGKKVSAFIGWIMTYPFNMVSQCPVMSVPSGFSETTGIPTGMQIVGRTYDDLSVFRAAAAFEAATQPWQKKRPAI